MAEGSADNVVLDLHCQGVKYGRETVLLPFHLQLVEGQHIAVLGASGAGKTTLLKVIFDHFNSVQQKIALIPQDLGLVENLSVYHNVYIGRLDQYSTFSNLMNLVSPKRDAKNIIQSILDTLSLRDKLLVPCGELSGGQQQRVAIARAIFRQAKLLIADEPVANLDQCQADIALNEMINNHTNCILALHNVSQAVRYCDRIVGIANGMITLDIPAAQLVSEDLTDVYKTLNVQQINS